MDFIEQRKLDRTALVNVLEAAGANFRGNTCNCPFHEDKHPSAGIYQTEKGFWFYKCHSCGLNGSIFDIEAKSNGMTTPEWLSAFRVNLEGLGGTSAK